MALKFAVFLTMVACISGCGRSTWTADQAGSPAEPGLALRIAWVRSPIDEVAPGQHKVQTSVRFDNTGAEIIELSAARLVFFDVADVELRGFTQRSEHDGPVLLAPGESSVIEFSVDVPSNATIGGVEIGALVFARSASLFSAIITDVGERHHWEVVDPEAETPTLAYSLISHPIAHPGQTGLVARVYISNPSTREFSIVTTELKLVRDSLEASAEFSIEPFPDNSMNLPSEGGLLLAFSIDIPETISAGDFEVDGKVTLRSDTGAVSVLDGVTQRAQLRVGAPNHLVVNQLTDEDDTSGDASVESAGGALDISLREALLISNRQAFGHHITFSAAVFPETIGGTIVLDSPLPTITSPGTWIDGQGASVSIDGSTLGIRALAVSIEADDVTLEGFRLGASAIDGPNGVTILGGLRTNLRRLELDGLGNDSAGGGAQVRFSGGATANVADCEFRGWRGGAVVLGPTTTHVTVTGNRFFANAGPAIDLSGRSHEVFQNHFLAVGSRVYDASDSIWRENIFASGGSGLHIIASQAITVADSDFALIPGPGSGADVGAIETP